MDWFRMYGDMPNNPKIGTLSDSEFRTWVELLCAACKAEAEGSTKLTAKTVNWALRRDVTENVTALSQIGLVTVSRDGEYVVSKWKERQFESDSSTKRTRKYRERKAAMSDDKANDHAGLGDKSSDETSRERHGDALEQNRTDTDKNKETTLSGKPDDVTPEPESPETAQAREAIQHLNEKTNSGYRLVKSNLGMVRARLAEGYTLDDVKAVIDRQVERWGSDEKMQEYLRPKTLFAASNFASYAGRIKRVGENWWEAAGFATRFEAENFGCNQNTAHQFQGGKRLEVHA